jgi:hypothetical protein
MQMDPATSRFGFSTGGLTVDGNDLFHEQIASRLQVPIQYYRRMRATQPELLARNVNTWLHAEPEKRLVRTYGPVPGAEIRTNVSPADRAALTVPNLGRAFLSDRYRPLDNFDMLNAMLPPLLESGLDVKSSQVTDSRIYLQLVTEKITSNLLKPGTHDKINDPVQMGLVVSNSETGCGALSISVMVYRLVCSNGLIIGSDDSGFRKAHLGGRTFSDSDIYLSNATRRKKDEALWSECRDVIRAAVNQTNLDRIVEKIAGVQMIKLADPVKAVEIVSDRYGFNQDERGSIMQHLISGGDATQWGLINAITRTAEDVGSYDRAVELETIGGKLLSAEIIQRN